MNTNQYKLTNDHCTATFTSKGAQLTSLRTPEREYLWQADPSVWGRHAPILFPIVGRLQNNTYRYNGKSYAMGQHGFARDSYFECAEKSENHLVFSLKMTDDTKKQYPFDFILSITYHLQRATLTTTYVIENPSQRNPLYFSVGAHPAFKCLMETTHKREDYAIVFNKKLSPPSMNNKNGLYLLSTTQPFAQDGKLPLTTHLFDDGSLTFNPNPFSEATLIHEPTQKKYLCMTFENYPYLGIWSKNRTSPFICIEPWHGIADYENGQEDFTQKPGIIYLEAGRTFSCEFTIAVF